jgi:hypothetical protein
MLIKYEQAKEILQEGDILLFRGEGLISFFIKRYTGGVHSHVALASKYNNTWMCVEFREFKGGRSVSLLSQVEENKKNIDVFRPVKTISYDKMDENGNISLVEKKYTKDIASAMTEDIIKWTGQPYGWINIFKMFLRFIPFARFFQQNINDDDVAKAKVCSTAVTVALRKEFMDPVPYLADERVSPADLARSPVLQYLFTIDGTKEG